MGIRGVGGRHFLGRLEHGDAALVGADAVAAGRSVVPNRFLLSLRDPVVLGGSLKYSDLPTARLCGGRHVAPESFAYGVGVRPFSIHPIDSKRCFWTLRVGTFGAHPESMRHR